MGIQLRKSKQTKFAQKIGELTVTTRPRKAKLDENQVNSIEPGDYLEVKHFILKKIFYEATSIHKNNSQFSKKSCDSYVELSNGTFGIIEKILIKNNITYVLLYSEFTRLRKEGQFVYLQKINPQYIFVNANEIAKKCIYISFDDSYTYFPNSCEHD